MLTIEELNLEVTKLKNLLEKSKKDFNNEIATLKKN